MPDVIVTGLGIADTPGSFVSRSVSRLSLGWGGIEGDRHFGLTRKADVRQPYYPRGIEIRNAREVSILAVEELEQIASALGVPRLDWLGLGGNLCLAGLKGLTQLAPSSRLLFPSGAALAIDGENQPCIAPGKILQHAFGESPHFAARFVKAAHRRRGLVAWVERPGTIDVGDTVKVVPPPDTTTPPP